MKNRALMSLCSSVIVFQIGIGFSLLTYASTDTATRSPNSKLTAENIVRPLIAQLMLDPVFAAFANAPQMPKPQIDIKDPAVDRDPFFLRSQEWTSLSGQADSREISFTKEKDASLSLHVPGARKTLRLSQALAPVLFTEEYIFLTADQNSQIFSNASGRLENGQTVGEGLFFINTAEWVRAAQVSAPVKVHFFPLPGHGWTGQIEADHIADQDTVSVASSEGDWLPVEMEDVRQIEKVQSLNALLGAVVAVRSNSATPGGITSLVPARGSTYAFGTLFTGFDLDNPANSLARETQFMLKPLWASFLKLFSIKEANAALEVSAELVDKLIRFGWTFGAIAAVSVGMKYTILKDKFKERYAIRDLRMVPMLEFDFDTAKRLYHKGFSSRQDLMKATPEAIADGSGLALADADKLRTEAMISYNAPATAGEMVLPEGKIARLTYQTGVRLKATVNNGMQKYVPEKVRKGSAFIYKEVVENGDVFAHSLTTVSQIRPVLTGNIVERLTDRYMPETAAGGNRLMRKVLNYVFYWGRSVASGTPVSLKTFMLGGVVMGTIDTYFVYVQQVAFIPWAAQGLAPYLPASLEDRIVKTFEPGNAQTRSLIVNDVIRNYVGWMTAGASGYSQDTQQQFEPQVRKQVDDELKRAGKNPLDPELKEERDRKYNDAMNLKLKRQGLPDQADFLFDPNTIDSYVLQQLGIRLPDDVRSRARESAFIGEARPALIKSALLRAIEMEKETLKSVSSASRVAALQILEDTRKDLALPFLASDPINGMRNRKRLLAMLTLLTYTGKVDSLVRHVPELWLNVDADGAREAAFRFRQAFFAFYNGDGTLIKLPPDFVNAEIDVAKKSARLALANKYGLKPFADGLTDVSFNRQAEFALLVEDNLRLLYAARNRGNAANNVANPDANWYQRRQDRKAYAEAAHEMSWYEKIQHQRSYRKTMERVAADTGNVSQATLNKYYSEAMAAEVSLYPIAETIEEKTVLEFILLKAASDTVSEMSHDPLKTHISKLELQDKAQLEMRIFAMNYLESYRSATIDQGLVHPRNPIQPGFTQKFRQKHRDSKILTVLARIVDSGFSDEVGYKMGLKAKLYRNIPTLFDLSSSTARLGKLIITGSTLGWAYQKLVWGVNIPFASFLLFFLVSPLISAPSQWLNRAFRQQNLQPMGGIISKTVYGIPYAWVTFGATIPWVLYSNDAMVAVKAMGTAIAAHPIVQTLGTFGEMSLPWLPALAVIPILTEIRERYANRKAIREGKLKLDKLDNSVSLSDLANPTKSDIALEGGRTCELLFKAVH